jgi:sigma-B regulation protein RsbU (phosphoserine phosphatase)
MTDRSAAPISRPRPPTSPAAGAPTPPIETSRLPDDQSETARLRAAELRDAIADARDVAALARDQAAAARDVTIAQAAALDEQPGGAAAELTGADAPARTATPRAAQRRADAAEHRVRAAEDRLMAERDRAEAARERRRALVDREMLVSQLQRERELRREALEHQHRAERLARALQRGLLPQRLPAIDGLDVGVYYEPSASEEVGGDFYDVFRLADGRSGFFLGDVCGHGPEAAAMTSLARYTMRTAAMLHETPSAILADLNAALLMHSDRALRTCTAVYGQIDTSCPATAVTLAVAGHPPPLIVRADARIQATPAHGTLLGAIDAPTFVTCRLELAAGDAIVIYSDGVYDVEVQGVRIDEPCVARLLCGAAQASAQELVDRLALALNGVERPLRDDVAIMALRRTA